VDIEEILLSDSSSDYTFSHIRNALNFSYAEVIRERAQFVNPEKCLDLLFDAEFCLTAANLSEEEQEAVFLVWQMGNTQKEAAEKAGIGRQAVGARLKRAEAKLTEVLRGWAA